MKYQLADLVNGPFGDIFATLEEAEMALAHEVAEGQKWNNENAEEGFPITNAQEFFHIVEVK